MEQAEVTRLERLIDREVKARFTPGTVRRVTLLQHGDDPAIGPDELLVRVFAAASGPAGHGQQALDEWAQAHETGMRAFFLFRRYQTGMRRLRRELSLRLPPARLLEFTMDGGGDAAPRICLPDDPALADQPLPGREVAATAASRLLARSVFPDRAEQAAVAIETRLAAGEYDELDEGTLAERLTRQMYEICADKHLRVRVTPPRPVRPEPGDPARPGPGRGPAGPGARRREQERGHPGNYGISRVERLDGNVGYLDLRGVAHPGHGAAAIAAAMELVSGTYALIIDLRRNGGGSPEGVVFWCSYLFPGDGTHLNDIFDAGTGETRQFWTLAHVPGARYLDRPVYLLTSHGTFSGGEDFCYTLQAQGRAELIGETTGGGAHPTRTIPVSPSLAISVPHARSVNPVTGTNWEGTGVTPDIAVAAAEAYDVAYARALRHVLTLDVPPPVAEEARAALATLEALEASAPDQPSAPES